MSTSQVMFIYFIVLNSAWICATLVIWALAARKNQYDEVIRKHEKEYIACQQKAVTSIKAPTHGTTQR